MSSPAPTQRPSISLLMAAYGTEQYVAQAIESMLAQTREDWELVVVDNGNVDAMAEIIGRYTHDPRVVLIRHENRGLAGARNSALAIARGRHVACLDSDDWVLPTYVETMVGVLDDRPEIGLVTCDARAYLDDLGVERSTTFFARAHRELGPIETREQALAQLFRWENMFIYYGAAMRREAMDLVGEFSTEVAGAVDMDMWLRAVDAGVRIHVVKEPLAVYRIRGASLSQSDARLAPLEDAVMAIMDRAATIAADMPEARATIETARRRYARERHMRLARGAMLTGSYGDARRNARAALRLGRSRRTIVAVAATHSVPWLLRRLHGPKNAIQRAVSRFTNRHAVECRAPEVR